MADKQPSWTDYKWVNENDGYFYPCKLPPLSPFPTDFPNRKVPVPTSLSEQISAKIEATRKSINTQLDNLNTEINDLISAHVSEQEESKDA